MVTSGATSRGALAQLVSNNPSSPVQRADVLAYLDRVASTAAAQDSLFVGLIRGARCNVFVSMTELSIIQIFRMLELEKGIIAVRKVACCKVVVYR
jgi:hypothetical protein